MDAEIPFDEFREANPLHEAQLLADLINWEPAIEMPERPEDKTVQCAKCHEWFEAEAQEFRGRWLFASLCSSTCQGPGSDALVAKCEAPRIRAFECPRCGIPKSLEAERADLEWHYYGQCSQCGYPWANAYKLSRKCPSCGKHAYLTSKNPTGKCFCDGSGPDVPFVR